MAAHDDTCWICLDDDYQEDNPLIKACDCPRAAHAKCLARWQFHSAGREEEKECRFCHKTLTDWKEVAVSEPFKERLNSTKAMMAIMLNGVKHKIYVTPDKEGAKAFTNKIRELYGLDDDTEFDVVFHCKDPHSGDPVKIAGIKGYDAAVHCAKVASVKNKRLHEDLEVNNETLLGSVVKKLMRTMTKIRNS
jgi:hypothetical protein